MTIGGGAHGRLSASVNTRPSSGSMPSIDSHPGVTSCPSDALGRSAGPVGGDIARPSDRGVDRVERLTAVAERRVVDERQLPPSCDGLSSGTLWIATSRSACGTGRPWTISASNAPSTAALAPMPSASEAAAIVVNPGMLAEHPQAVDDVLPEIVDPRHAALVATGFLERGDVAERAMRRPSRVVRRQAVLDLFGDELVEMKGQLAMELGVDRVLARRAIAVAGARRGTVAGQVTRGLRRS